MPAPELLPAPDLLADEMSVLLHDGEDATAPAAPARQRLFARVARSAAAARRMHTRRHADTVAETLADGVQARELYRAPPLPLRPGEPQRSRLIELAPGARWTAEPGPWQREWLVLAGSAALGGLALGTHDFLLQPADAESVPLHSEAGALVLLREAPPQAGAQALLQRAVDARWGDYGPGIERRVMWQQDGQAAMLYRTRPGAAVPRHGHRHDEECLMLAGDVFLDEVLLRPLDYQLAPAGTHHDSVGTDTGLLLYAHGDLDLDLQP
jgi:quercetin dioxygenase-like cupin family protein